MQRKQYIPAYLLAAAIMMVASYSLPRWLPGDFVTAMYASSHVTLNAEQEKDLRAYYTESPGFGRYLAGFFTLNWGYSYAFLTPISELILGALPWTLLLMGGAHLLSMVFGFIAGVEAAWRRGGLIEKAGVGSMTLLEGVPEIGTGVILLLLFALHLGWLPAAGGETAYAAYAVGPWLLDLAAHLVLPLTTLFLAYFPGNFLLTRGGMVMVLKQQFLETARAKGLPPLRYDTLMRRETPFCPWSPASACASPSWSRAPLLWKPSMLTLVLERSSLTPSPCEICP
jgi:peptide/nickel transport system permease protein